MANGRSERAQASRLITPDGVFGGGSFAMSLGAMLVSSITFYLTYFDQRYTLTAAVDTVRSSVQRGASSNGAERSVSFRYFAEPSFILSHRGTRPLVMTQLRLVKSAAPDHCAASQETASSLALFEPIIIEPDTVRRIAAEFELPQVTASNAAGAFALEPRADMWCLQFTIFDHTGRREEPMLQAFTQEIDFDTAPQDDDYPTTAVETEFPSQPVTLASQGLF